MRASILAASLVFAGSAAAQSPQAPPADPKSVAPVTATPGVEARPRVPATAGRNQFIAPVMNIDIKADGLALPTGVAQPEEPIVAPVQPPAAPAAPAK